MNEDFRDLLRALSDVEARFLVVGAYAVAVHGRPRATGNLNVWVDPTPQNSTRVMSGLRRFGAPLLDLSEQDLCTPGVVFQMGYPPRRIDILTSISGVDFAEAWEHRITAPFADVNVPVIGIEELIANKRACGRAKDLADIEVLERLRTLV